MRCCSNPECRIPITGCNGFVKAGDVLEVLAGIRNAGDIRELCGKCALAATVCVSNGEITEPAELPQIFFARIGWAH